MKITHLSFSGIKSSKGFNGPVKPCCIITGDNASGKTAFTDAVRLGLLGYAPELGKANSATFSLCGGKSMATELDFDDGQVTSWHWFKDGKGVKVEPGSSIAVPSIMFNASEFFRMTAKQRTAALFAIVGQSVDFPLKDIVQAIHTAAKDDMDIEAFSDIKQTLETKDQERAEADIPLNDWLADLIETLKSEQTANAATARQMQASIAAKVQLAASQPPRPSTAGIEGRIEAAQTELAALKARQKELQTMIDKADIAARQLKEVRRLEASVAAMPDPAQELATLEASLPALYERTTKPLTAPALQAKADGLRRDIESDKERVSEKEKIIQRRQADLKRVQAGIDTVQDPKNEIYALDASIPKLLKKTGQPKTAPELKARLEGLNREIEQVNTNRSDLITRLRQAMTERQRLDEVKCCPTCGAKNTKWQDPAKAALDAQIADLDAQTDGNKSKSAALMQELDAIAADIKTAIAADEAIEAAVREYQAASERKHALTVQANQIDADKRLLATINEQLASLTAEKKKLVADIADAQVILDAIAPQLEAAKQADAIVTQAIAEYRDDQRKKSILQGLANRLTTERNALAVQKAAVQAVELPENIDNQVALTLAAIVAAQLLIHDLQAAQRQAIAHKAEDKAMSDAKTAMDACEKRARLYKAACLEIVAFQNRVITENVGNFIRKSSRIFSRVHDKHLLFEDGEIGYRNGHGWVSHETFSGSEMVLAYAGFALALAAEAPVKVVVIDELGRLDAQRKTALMRVVLDMLDAGEIDNFFGIDVDAAPYRSIEGETNSLQVIAV